MDCDWWFVFEIFRRLGRHGALKIILKDDQKHVPVIGWGLKGFGFIFLRRDWAKDRYSGYPGSRAPRDNPKQALLTNDMLLFSVGGSLQLLVYA